MLALPSPETPRHWKDDVIVVAHYALVQHPFVTLRFVYEVEYVHTPIRLPIGFHARAAWGDFLLVYRRRFLDPCVQSPPTIRAWRDDLICPAHIHPLTIMTMGV